MYPSSRFHEKACLEAQESGETVDLATFVNTHFDIPEMISATSQTKFANVADYIEHMWQVLTRTPDTEQKDSLIALTRPYIVPGGRFREIYYWDTNSFASVPRQRLSAQRPMR